MASSYSSSRTSSGSCVSLRKEPEVTVDDVAEVVTGLNTKVLQLRKEILALRGYPRSDRSTGPVGYHSPEDGQSKMAEREFQKKEEYYFPRRRKHNSQPTRKNSRLTHAGNVHRADEHRLSNQDKTPAEHKARREKSIKSEANGYSDKTTNRKASSESSGRIRTDKTIREPSHRISTERRKSRDTGKIFTDKSKLGYTKSNESYVDTSRNRKISRQKKNRHSADKEEAKSLDVVKNNEKPITTSGEYERDRIVLPSRVSLKCQGIRHAFGLSNAYCNCDSTGSGVRRVRKKRISRGVQCNGSDICKHKISSALGGCFAFKCCAGKTKQSRRRKSKNSAKKTESVASSGIYRPKKKEYKKETKGSKEAIGNEILAQKVTRNHRMIGGGEEITPQRLQIAEAVAPKRNQKTDSSQRHQRLTRRKMKAIEDHPINKNDILYVKRRLNECLIELNGIIGNAGFIFEENNQHG